MSESIFVYAMDLGCARSSTHRLTLVIFLLFFFPRFRVVKWHKIWSATDAANSIPIFVFTFGSDSIVLLLLLFAEKPMAVICGTMHFSPDVRLSFLLFIQNGTSWKSENSCVHSKAPLNDTKANRPNADTKYNNKTNNNQRQPVKLYHG